MAQINIQYTADIQQLNAKLDQIIQKNEQVASSSQKAGKEMSEAAKKSSDEIGFLNNSLGKLQSAVVSAFAIGSVVAFTKSLIDAERSMELVQNRLNFLAGSAQSGERLFNRLQQTSMSLGISIEDLSEGMASFGIAAKQAGFSAQQSEKIFTQVAVGLRAAGASSLQTQRSFYALQQMMSKGVVAAEELRRQLGESLPGASDLMTEAYNRLHPSQQVTNLEFTKLLESGKIISREVLPEFANVIEETFAPALAGKKNSLDAALTRVNNEILKLKLNIGDGEFFNVVATKTAGILENFNKIIASNESFLEKTGRTLWQVLTFQQGNVEFLKEQDEIQQRINEDDERKRKNIEQEIALLKNFTPKQLSDKKEELKTLVAIGSQKIKSGNTDRLLSEVHEKNQAVLFALFQLEKEVQEKREKDAAENAKIQEQVLKDAVALAKIRVEQALKGTIEESDARAELAKKQGDLDVFMAKSSAEAQLARVKAEVEANKQIEESRTRTAEALSQIVVEEDVDMTFLKSQKKELEQYAKDQEKILDAIAAPFLDAQDLEIVAVTKKYRELIALTKRDSNERKLLEEALQQEIQKIRDKYAKIRAEKEADISLKISNAISSPYMSAMEKEISSTIDHYEELIKLADGNAEKQKALEEALQKELQNIRERYADKEAKGLEKKIKEYARLASQIASQSSTILNGFAEADRQMRENQLEADLQILNARFEAGVLSEKDYNAKVAEIKREQFQRDKEAAIAKIKIDTALAVLNAFATLPLPLAIISTPFIIGLGAAQVSAVESTPIPTFHEGGIAIGDGAKMTSGPLKSDEFIAKLQRGESVIDRQDTQKYKDELSAIREGKFEDYIASKYIVPALERSIDKKQTSTNATSMEMAFQAAEMVNAIKGNKVIKLHKSSIKELAGHIGPKATDKVLARRSWR